MITCVRASNLQEQGTLVLLEGHRALRPDDDDFDILRRRISNASGGSTSPGDQFEPWTAQIPAEFTAYAALFPKHLCCLMDTLDDSWALDFHQTADEDSGSFERTPLGEVVYQAKYRVSDSERDELALAMEEFIQAHPLYAAAHYITAVPSTRRLPQLLAMELCRRSGKDICDLHRVNAVQLQKDVPPDQKESNQLNSMHCRTALPTAAAVIVVDDLLETGGTIAEAARALREGGAYQVLGLVATKTMKGTRGGGPW